MKAAKTMTAAEESFAIVQLANVTTLEAFDDWWERWRTVHNRVAVTDPRAWERIARAIEAMHYRRRKREGQTNG